ncbi:hypothetical protein GWI33_019271 [Rhynchophorus ferrugineus]|uniref:Uncharacterized protein n=1 Tax=Rhynchophorus ferrugineus TaxID=354439 RepID=A0A834M0M3_RHYFE|nr:hypothetical protein GWI33_019271 [Rhynchophorus ferrugineus]
MTGQSTLHGGEEGAFAVRQFLPTKRDDPARIVIFIKDVLISFCTEAGPGTKRRTAARPLKRKQLQVDRNRRRRRRRRLLLLLPRGAVARGEVSIY